MSKQKYKHLYELELAAMINGLKKRSIDRVKLWKEITGKTEEEFHKAILERKVVRARKLSSLDDEQFIRDFLVNIEAYTR